MAELCGEGLRGVQGGSVESSQGYLDVWVGISEVRRKGILRFVWKVLRCEWTPLVVCKKDSGVCKEDSGVCWEGPLR